MLLCLPRPRAVIDMTSTLQAYVGEGLNCPQENECPKDYYCKKDNLDPKYNVCRLVRILAARDVLPDRALTPPTPSSCASTASAAADCQTCPRAPLDRSVARTTSALR